MWVWFQLQSQIAKERAFFDLPQMLEQPLSLFKKTKTKTKQRKAEYNIQAILTCLLKQAFLA